MRFARRFGTRIGPVELLKACAFVLALFSISACATSPAAHESVDAPAVVVAKVVDITLIPEINASHRRRDRALWRDRIIDASNSCGTDRVRFQVVSVLSGKTFSKTIEVEGTLDEWCESHFPVSADVPLLLVVRQGEGRLVVKSWSDMFTDAQGNYFLLPDQDGKTMGLDLRHKIVPTKPEPEFGFGRVDEYTGDELRKFIEESRGVACVVGSNVDVCGAVRLEDWLESAKTTGFR